MNKVVFAIIGAVVVAVTPAAFAQSSMQKGDGMSQTSGAQGMSKDGMSKDGMKKDSMQKDGMQKDGMKKDGMMKKN